MKVENTDVVWMWEGTERITKKYVLDRQVELNADNMWISRRFIFPLNNTYVEPHQVAIFFFASKLKVEHGQFHMVQNNIKKILCPGAPGTGM